MVSVSESTAKQRLLFKEEAAVVVAEFGEPSV